MLLFRTGLDAIEAKWPQERWNLCQRFEQVRECLGEPVSPRYLYCGLQSRSKCYPLESEARGILKQQHHTTEWRVATKLAAFEFWFVPTLFCNHWSKLYAYPGSESMGRTGIRTSYLLGSKLMIAGERIGYPSICLPRLHTFADFLRIDLGVLR